MQIYTKILIGMAVGTAIGLALGPNSELLAHDTFLIPDGSMIELRLEPSPDAPQIPVPPRAKLRLRMVDRIDAQMQDETGETHDVMAWAKVELEYSQEIGLRDASGALRKMLGDPEPGAAVTVWLRLTVTPLEGGGVASAPVPISGLGDTVITWLSPVGDVFMRLIKMVIVPLVFASLLVGVASLGDVRKLGRLGGKTLGLYFMTTAIAVSIGLLVAHVINPGRFVDAKDKAQLMAQFGGDVGAKVEAAAEAPSTLDNILAIIPANPVESLASGDMLQIIFFAVIFGVALTLVGNDAEFGQPVVRFFDRVQQAMVVIIHMVMALAPYGVAALIAKVVGMSGFSVLGALLVYGLTVLVGLAIHAALVYGGLVKFLARLPWVGFMRAIRPAQLIAFSTSSSSATLPVSLECAEENLGVSNSVSSFVLPLGSTVNMDGTALYQGVAAIFIAQVFDMHLGVGAQISIVAAATMASVGAAGVPGAGMVTLAMVLTASGIPQVGLALILGMDRLLDMFRTAVNVTGDLAVAAVMAASEGEKLRILGRDADASDPDRGFESRLDRPEHKIDPS